MARRASVIDMLKDVVENMVHQRTSAESEAHSEQTARLRAMQQYNSQRTMSGPQPSVSRSLGQRLGRKVRLVAYTKCGGEANPANAQLEAIHRYCLLHDYEIAYHMSWDENFPMMALNTALDALDFADGLIVSDLDRLIQHQDDPGRDLNPMIQDYFFQNRNYLISVKEGIDTSTIVGQTAFVQHLRDLQPVA